MREVYDSSLSNDPDFLVLAWTIGVNRRISYTPWSSCYFNFGSRVLILRLNTIAAVRVHS